MLVSPYYYLESEKQLDIVEIFLLAILPITILAKVTHR